MADYQCGWEHLKPSGTVYGNSLQPSCALTIVRMSTELKALAEHSIMRFILSCHVALPHQMVRSSHAPMAEVINTWKWGGIKNKNARTCSRQAASMHPTLKWKICRGYLLCLTPPPPHLKRDKLGWEVTPLIGNRQSEGHITADTRCNDTETHRKAGRLSGAVSLHIRHHLWRAQPI